MKTQKQTKQVQIIARAQFKADSRKVCYQVKSSNGKDTYWTCLFDGKATSCECPATKPCYHMTGCEKLEAQAEQTHEQVVQGGVRSEHSPLDKVFVHLDDKIAFDNQVVAKRKQHLDEIKADVFQALKQQFDYRSAAPVATVASAPIAARGTRTVQRAFSLMR